MILSPSLSVSASLEGSGGEGVRCLVRREARDLTLAAGDGALDPARDAARDIVRVSTTTNETVFIINLIFTLCTDVVTLVLN